MPTIRSDAMQFLARPPVLSSVARSGGRVRSRLGEITMVAASAAQNDIVCLARFAATDHIFAALLVNDALGAAVTGDLGCYVAVNDPDALCATLVSGTAEDRFATAVDLNTAREQSATLFSTQNIWNESATQTPTTSLGALWQQCGLAAEPASGTMFDVGLKLEGADPGAGYVGVLFLYTGLHS